MLKWIRMWLGAPFEALAEWWREWRKPRPPIQYVGPDGVGWRHPPNWLEADYADVGQHDTWKREMRIFLLRAHACAAQDFEDPGTRSIDLAAFRLAATGWSGSGHTETVSVLWPMDEQLAGACRRLGFVRLAEAAVEPMELTLEDLEAIHRAARRAAEREARRRAEVNGISSQNWNEQHNGGPFQPDPPSATLAAFDPGPFEPLSPWPPLQPLRLHDATDVLENRVDARHYMRLRRSPPS